MKDEYFGEWVEYKDGEENEAKQYLKSWEKFFQRRVKEMQHIETSDFIIREYDENLLGEKSHRKTMGLKIKMNGKLNEN